MVRVQAKLVLAAALSKVEDNLAAGDILGDTDLFDKLNELKFQPQILRIIHMITFN